MKTPRSILLILTLISFIACKKETDNKSIIVSNQACLKTYEGDISFEFYPDGRIKSNYYVKDGVKQTIRLYNYSGDTIIEKYTVPDIESGSLVVDKSVIGKNGFITKKYSVLHNFYGDRGLEYNYTYDSNNHLIFYTYGDKGYGSKFVYKNDNLIEKWAISPNDTTLSAVLDYDMNKENKEASWIEWSERTGKASKNLLIKESSINNFPNYFTEYSYSYSNGLPIQKSLHTVDSNGESYQTINMGWWCKN